MPFLRRDDVNLHYELEGPPHAPVLMFSNSLGTDLSMWDAQASTLVQSFRVLRYDTRGHGQTSVPPAPYSIEKFGGDAIALLDGLNITKTHFCGLSMGGQLGLWLAIRHPGRISRLVACNTGARIGNEETWKSRIEGIRKGGMKAVAAAVMERFLSPEFRARDPQTTAAMQRKIESISPDGYVACCEAIRDTDLTTEVAKIKAQTLVITGHVDPSTPPALGQFLRDHIPGAQYVELPTAHLSNIEAPAEFTANLTRFLAA